jgi:hypothetical protein
LSRIYTHLRIHDCFCQGGTEFIAQSTLACALDRLTLLAAGSESKIGAVFAKAELNRSYCGQRDPRQRQNTVCSGKQLRTARSPDALDAERQNRFASSP